MLSILCTRFPLHTCKSLCCFLALGLCTLMVGCATYNFGNQGLFPQNIQTVGISICGNETWRKGYGERLTEALIREIENRTPYKVVPCASELDKISPDCRADAILQVKIIGENKSVTFQNDWADPRELSIGMTIEAKLIDRQTLKTLQSQNISMEQEALQISSSTTLVTEMGQSNVTASQILMQNIAQHIVGMMEKPW